MSRRNRAAILASAVAATWAISAPAQTSQGTLVGVARDVTGAVVANATINVTNQETGLKRTATTSSDGSYRIAGLAPGSYTVIVTAAGFDTSTVKNVSLPPSIVTSRDISLTVGNTTTEVTVEASQTTINTDNGVLSGTVGAAELNKMPIFSLNPVELAVTVPGVQPVSTPGGQFSNGTNIQVNGSRPRNNNFLMDGQEMNDVGLGGQAFQPAIPDVFDSVTVFTNAAPAEFGRGGGGVVNLVTKSGTNSFHGSVFERYEGSGLNSVQGPFRGNQDFVKTRYNQHTFGFTAGGPILKNKLFAFGAGEWRRYYGQETPGVNLLPDAAGLATLNSITDPLAKSQVALLNQYLSNGSYLQNNIQYAPTAATGITRNVGALAGCPTGGCIVSFAGFQRPNQPEQSPQTQWMYRVDYHPWERDSIAVRYLHDRSSLTPDFFNNPTALAGFDTEQGGPSELAVGQWIHIFSPQLLNEFRAAETRVSFAFSQTAATFANPLNSLASLSFGNLSGNTTAGALTFPTLGPNQNFPQGRTEDLYQFQDTIRYTRGKNSFSFGADVGRILEIDLVSQNALGTVGFVAGGSGTTSLGNFLRNQLGPSGTATKTFGSTRADSHGWRSGMFGQDDLKISPDLTLNLGVRYDYLTNPINTLKYPGIDPYNAFAPVNSVLPVQNDVNNIAPRIGFAYVPHNVLGMLGDGKTSIRGGFGVFYDSTFSNILVNSAQSSPNAIAATLTQTTGNGLANANALIPTIQPVLNPQSTVTSEATNLVNPLTYQYNLGVEREVPGGIVMGLRYVGSRALKEFANQQFNYFDGNTGKRLNPSRGAINLRGNYADANYNGVEITGTHNFRHGLLIRANYIFGKDLDNGSEVFALDAGTSPASYGANLAPGGRRQEWGNSSYDHRQFFSVAYVYKIPGLHSSNHWADLGENILTRNWTVSGVSQLQSGSYATFNLNGIDANADGSTSNDRPVVVNKSAPLTSVAIDGHFVGGTTGVLYDGAINNSTGDLVPINVASAHFLVPYFPDNRYLSQEIGRNSFQQPGTTVHNLALEKGFDFRERASVVLRAEAQNVFNHNDNIAGDTNVLDAGAGFTELSRTATPALYANQRTVILWAKILF